MLREEVNAIQAKILDFEKNNHKGVCRHSNAKGAFVIEAVIGADFFA